MASSGRGGNDPAWKYATPVEGNRNGTTCIFCFATFKSGGITRLKSHLSGYDPHKSVKKCDKVPPEIKTEVIAWIKRKDSIKQEKAAVQDDIREELRNDYLGNQTSLYNDDDDNDDDDDGFQYPPDMHPAERQDYRAAVRRSTVDRDKNSQFSRSARFQFPKQSRGGSSSQQPQQVDRSKTYRYSFPEPPVAMPSKDSRSKQSTIKSLLKGGRELLATMVSKYHIYDAVPFNKADSPHFQNMLTTAGSGTGGGGERYEYGQSSVDGGFQFTCEGNFDHATQDEDHGVRTAGHGAQEKTRYGRRTRGATDDQSTPSDVSSIALSFDSISLGTERSGISNESHESNNQFGYDAYGYNQYGEVYDQSSSWVHPYYPLIGETVGSSKEIYNYHVHHYNSHYMGHMSWSDYCIFVDQRAAFQPPRVSF